MADFTIYSDIGTIIDSSLSVAMVQQAEFIMDWLKPLFNNILIIYFALWGIAHMLGKIDELLVTGISRIIKISIIIAFALNITIYAPVIIAFVYGSGTQLASIASGNETHHTNSLQELDKMMNAVFLLADIALKKVSIYSETYTYYFVAVFLWIGGIALTLFAAFLIISSKVLLSILLIAGPVFIVFSLFEQTKKFTESWISQLANYTLILFFVSVVLTIIIKITVETIKPMGEKNIQDAIVVFIAFAFGALILRQIPLLASSLGGGIAFSTMGAFAGVANRAQRMAALTKNTRPYKATSQYLSKERKIPAFRSNKIFRR